MRVLHFSTLCVQDVIVSLWNEEEPALTLGCNSSLCYLALSDGLSINSAPAYCSKKQFCLCCQTIILPFVSLCSHKSIISPNMHLSASPYGGNWCLEIETVESQAKKQHMIMYLNPPPGPPNVIVT